MDNGPSKCSSRQVPHTHTEDQRPFRVLQLTDLHTDVDEEANARTWADIRAMIDRFNPDMLAVIGDIWCGDDHPEDAENWMERDLILLGSLGVPWAFTWGNHDHGIDTPEGQARIAAAPFSLTSCDSANYRVEIGDANGSRPLWDLFFLNSHTECLFPDDLAWLEMESRRLCEDRGRCVRYCQILCMGQSLSASFSWLLKLPLPIYHH